MYASIRVIQVQPRKIDEAMRIRRDSVVPLARQQTGYRGALAFVDRGANRITTVMLWETESDMEAFATSDLYQEQLRKVGPLLVGPPEREVCEVGLSEVVVQP